MSLEAAEEIGHRFGGDLLGGAAGHDAVRGPFAENELHDGLAPAGEGDGGCGVVRITTTTDEGRVADAAWIFIERASGGGGGG